MNELYCVQSKLQTCLLNNVGCTARYVVQPKFDKKLISEHVEQVKTSQPFRIQRQECAWEKLENSEREREREREREQSNQRVRVCKLLEKEKNAIFSLLKTHEKDKFGGFVQEGISSATKKYDYFNYLVYRFHYLVINI